MAEQMVEARPSESQSEVSTTTTTTISEESVGQAIAPPTLRLVLRKPKNPKKVNWTTETVDNEHMNKRKSKCCCIYRKPHVFGESSSESEDECDNCYGHCELRKPLPNNNNPSPPPPPPSVPPVA